MGDFTTIAFIGSAKATPIMTSYAVKAIERSMDLGHLVYVGDNPSGIDLIVAKTALQADYKDIYVINVGGELSRSLMAIVAGEKPKSKHTFEQYHQRDMGIVDIAHICFFMWDGKSRGTKSAYDYALSIGRECILADFSQPGENGKYPKITKTPERQAV